MSFKPADLIQRLQSTAQEFMDEPGLAVKGRLSTLHRFVHFWIVVGRSFVRNRCPIRASALSYTTLLALVPLLAVVFGVTSSLLKSEGEQRINSFIDGLVASVTPPAMIGTNQPDWREFIGPAFPDHFQSSDAGETNSAALLSLVQDDKAIAARKEAAKWINEFVQNTRSGTMGVTGTILLLFVVISLMARIEETFNDIWGVTQGRTWFMKVIYYWAAVTLGPFLLVSGVALMSSSQAESIRGFIAQTGFIGNFIFRILPLFIVWLAFTVFYQLMPATKVRWSAAAAGGLIGGILWFLNNYFGFLYVSRVVTNSKIYGSLGLVPVFMVGLYFSWMILLFGAQVAYAFQNREAYLQERLAENINQRGREFVALRLMTAISQRFQVGQPPATVTALSAELGIPGRLVQQVMATLHAARLVIEVNGRDVGYAPGRPLNDINCHDILRAMRVTAGQEVATRDEPVRGEVLGEFARIEAAEQKAASSVTMLALAHRATDLEIAAPEPSGLTIPLKSAQPPPPPAAAAPVATVEPTPQAAPAAQPPVVFPPAEDRPQPVPTPPTAPLLRPPPAPTFQPTEQPFPD